MDTRITAWVLAAVLAGAVAMAPSPAQAQRGGHGGGRGFGGGHNFGGGHSFGGGRGFGGGHSFDGRRGFVRPGHGGGFFFGRRHRDGGFSLGTALLGAAAGYGVYRLFDDSRSDGRRRRDDRDDDYDNHSRGPTQVVTTYADQSADGGATWSSGPLTLPARAHVHFKVDSDREVLVELRDPQDQRIKRVPIRRDQTSLDTGPEAAYTVLVHNPGSSPAHFTIVVTSD
jgi:hypothetical protein